MFQKVTTLTEFILQEERKYPQATGTLSLLLTQLENASKIIASHVKRAGLADILGHAGTQNAYGEDQKKLDVYANDLLVEILLASGQVHGVASEELDEPLYSKVGGEYVVLLDPLDGSKNIDINMPIGTIFSIFHKSDGFTAPGRKQVAAGYIVYGSSVMFVYTSGHGVNGFTLDSAIGTYLLSHPDIKMPEKGKSYSMNTGYEWDDAHKKYMEEMKKTKSGGIRYVGALIADVHRTLVDGGIFLYPPTAKSPEGKLRLMFEINPMSMLIEQAGGAAASTNLQNPLDIVPTKLTHKVPIAFGSKSDVEEYIQIIKK